MVGTAQARLCPPNLTKAVIAREGGQFSIPETSVIDPRSRSVLDTPHARGMTTGYSPFTNFANASA